MLTLQNFIDTTEKLTGVQQIVVVKHDGTVIHKGNGDNIHLGDYVAYITVTAEQLKPYLGFTGPYHLIMEESGGNRILTLLGEHIITGIYLDAHASPATIMEQLAPIIDQVTI